MENKDKYNNKKSPILLIIITWVFIILRFFKNFGAKYGIIPYVLTFIFIVVLLFSKHKAGKINAIILLAVFIGFLSGFISASKISQTVIKTPLGNKLIADLNNIKKAAIITIASENKSNITSNSTTKTSTKTTSGNKSNATLSISNQTDTTPISKDKSDVILDSISQANTTTILLEDNKDITSSDTNQTDTTIFIENISNKTLNIYYEIEPYYYYGADLSQFPPKVKDWVMNRAFTREKMEKPFMINPKLSLWWGNDNNSVHAEASYIVARGYTDAGQLKTWGQEATYRGSSNLSETYGEYAKYQTLRFKWEQKQKVEIMLINDPAFAEIIYFAQKLCKEIEYDWANFNGYRGPVRRTPNLRYAVCSGYANEVMSKALKLNSVSSVQLWEAPGHAWNVLKLNDGRTLYFDLTWFDNEHINHETGIIYQTDDYGWSNITFDEHLFRFSNIGYGYKVFHHNKGRMVKEIKKK
ncbi:MAG: hypothetical protein LBV17_02585 [Treponema sp.]|jgi:hypothetical protein|nr:hypothetical protein [Treponema sp.]